MRVGLALFATLALSGCCQTRCLPTAVAVVVSADGASVSGVEIDGFVCDEREAGTVCTPNGPIEDGDHRLEVRAPGYEPVVVTLRVRTHVPPPFSCACRVQRGEARVELGAGASDAGEPPLDGGAGDSG
ncbi:MAG TPA: hypothetical protein VIL20_28975, partial [Sandaracinaceae bacterium]